MNKKERYKFCIEYFKEHNPSAATELNYLNPFQLIVAVILSAQCTDKRVNLITPDLFKSFPDAASMANATQEEVFDKIKSCSYPNNKTKHLINMAKTLIDKFSGIIPAHVDELQKLPGVGRKTANVVASVVFDIPAMAVDTHVFRVSARIGLTTNAKNPLEAEKQLVKNIPEKYINISHHWLILHGRYVCTARNPKCEECGIKVYCKYYNSTKSKKA
ncbi:endonuclease III [Bacteroidota bacterium]